MVETENRVLLSSPHMGGKEMKYIEEAFTSNWIAPLGANVDGFEQALSARLGEGSVVALSSGTAALHLAMVLAGVAAGDLVFCQDLTFSASVNPVLYQGGRPVFIDSERETWNMDPAALRLAIERYGAPKAVVAVDLYGTPAALEDIAAICREHDIRLIEDAAEALGGSCGGRPCGTFGDFGVLSFNGNKIITTSGGGALVCRREEDERHALKLATQAREPVPWYEHREVGYNYRLSNICAGIGRGQMEVLDQRLERKREIFAYYRDALSGLPVTMQPFRAGDRPNHWLSSILLDEDSGTTPHACIAALDRANIEARHIWKPMHLQPVFLDAPYVSADGAGISEDIFSRGVCLPSDTKMTDGDLERVCGVLREALV